MKTKIIGLFGMMVFSAGAAAAGSVPLWEFEYSLTGARESGFSPTVLDRSANSYFAGYSVVKVTSDGRQAWATRLPSQFFGQVAVDTSGNVYVGGTFFTSAGVDFGVLKYDQNGQLVWQATYDPSDHTDDWANDVGCDAAGNVYLGGRSYNSAIRGAYHTVLKYDGNGTLLWARRFDGGTNSTPHNTGRMALNPLGGVAVSGTRTIVSYSAEGELLWSWLGEGAPENRLLAFDNAGNLFTEHRNLRVSKFSRTGQLLWKTGYDSPVSAEALALLHLYANDLKVDALGNAFIVADVPIRCEIVTEDDDNAALCRYLPLVVKFGPEGKLLWSSRFSAPTNQYLLTKSLAVDNAGGVHVLAQVGEFEDLDLVTRPIVVLLGTCDADGNQVSRATYASDSPRELWPYHLLLDPRQDLIMAAELIDREISEIDYLAVKFRVTTEERLRVLKSPKAQTATTGSTVTFRVVTTRHGRTRYQWRFNGEPIAGAIESTLTLRNVRRENAGHYSVEVSDGARQIVTPEARLEVLP